MIPPENHINQGTPEPSVSFNWQEVYDLAGESVDSEGNLAALADALGDVLGWLVDGDATKDARIPGRRTLALVWALRPDLLHGVSLPRMAKSLGCSTRILRMHTAMLRERWGIRNRSMTQHPTQGTP